MPKETLDAISMSAQAYVGPGVRIADRYDVIGVSCEVWNFMSLKVPNGNASLKLKEKLLKEAEKLGAEIVTDTRYNFLRNVYSGASKNVPANHSYGHVHGTALIKKKEKS